MKAVARAEESRVPWDPAAAVCAASRVAAGEAPGRLLKQNRHGRVVWVDRAGPRGEEVVVKSRYAKDVWDRARARVVGSPCQQHADVARQCEAAGVCVPTVLGVVDGPEGESHVVSTAVVGASPLADVAASLAPRRRLRLARVVGRFVASLHRAGIYAPDLKHENLLVADVASSPRIVLVDLDRARVLNGGLSRRRRIRNLVQLCWRLSWETTERERELLFRQYVSAMGETAASGVRLAQDVDRARRAKQRRLLRKRQRRGSRPTERPGISAMIICQNEARRIRPCLESVSWCDEIVVVDGGSTDGTVEICREFTPRVIENAWPGHRAQKQFALDQTRMPWVLNVDSDERVPAPLREEIEWILAHDGAGFDGFQVPRLVRYLGRWWWRGGWYPSRRLRLFRRERTEWGGVDPHEKAVVHGATAHIKEPLWHLSYEDVAHHLRSIDRLTEVAARAAPRRARWDRLYLRPPARFLRSWLLGRGFLEGFPGFFIALASAVYVHVKHVKADEEARLAERS